MQTHHVQIKLPWGGTINIERKPRDSDGTKWLVIGIIAYLAIVAKIIITAIG